MRTNNKLTLADLTQFMMVLGWLTLPLSHLRWLPELGTTRPLSAIPFTLAFMLILITDIIRKGVHLSSLAGWEFVNEHLRRLPGWQFLRWWLILTALGVISTAITPFYGSPLQALNRLLGYGIIFIFIYSALYSLQSYGIEAIAQWVSIGYVPVLLYAVIEAIATQNVSWAYQVILHIRGWLIVPFNWVGRTALLATEPSFVSFQILLLITIFPFLRNKFLRLTNLSLLLISVLFSKSGMVFVLLLVYLLFWALFSIGRKTLLRSVAAIGAVAIVASVVIRLSLWARSMFINAIEALLSSQRMSDMLISATIRVSYILNLIYVLVETRGLGVGIGQYGLFWKQIYLRYINYKSFDAYGEVSNALASTNYMRPYSVVFGMGSDLGIIGLILFFTFIYQVFRCCQTAHAKAIMIAGFIALLGAYPIVTPHVWLALALMGGYGLQSKLKQA